jgi:outer membrane protein
MCRHFTFTLFFGFTFFTSLAQKTWDLKTCVTYAMSNNLSVKQSEVQANFSVLTFKQSKFSQIPGLNLATSTAFNTGNNQDPTTYSRVTENYLSAGMQLQSSA